MCSCAWRTVTLRSTKPSARSARMPTSFFEPIAGGTAVAGLATRPASIDDVVGAHARALDLEVAADAAAEVGDPVAVPARRLAERFPARPAAHHRDQVLVVGAVELVLVGDRARPGRGRWRSRTRSQRGVVGRLRARGRLGVEAGHDHDAVVVARRRSPPAGSRGSSQRFGELAVDPQQRLAPACGGQSAMVGRADVVAVPTGACESTSRSSRERVRLADDAGLARAAFVERRGQRPHLRDLAAGRRAGRCGRAPGSANRRRARCGRARSPARPARPAAPRPPGVRRGRLVELVIRMPGWRV